ncbi:pilus assembly protein N-terminal domain-containing protein [Roseixanthobacter liquoris]|uniref:pilus assembly protein N-terminal domain-containing protein n=1 Tax=Roseixanthobacter liquoris TaxID=3119921 RepID=UPI00372A30E4
MSGRPIMLLAGLLAAAAPLGRMSCRAAETGQPRTIALPVGASEVFRAQPGIATILLGNPAIADVSLINSTTLAITGKARGATNLILLSPSGSEISRTALQIGPQQAEVTFFVGEKARIYSCAPTCVALANPAPAGVPAAEAAAGTAPGGSAPPADPQVPAGGPQ